MTTASQSSTSTWLSFQKMRAMLSYTCVAFSVGFDRDKQQTYCHLEWASTLNSPSIDNQLALVGRRVIEGREGLGHDMINT